MKVKTKSPTAKDRFITELAKYLVGNQVEQSIWLEMGDRNAQQWAAIRDQTPLFGYPTVDEAEVVLRKFLS